MEKKIINFWKKKSSLIFWKKKPTKTYNKNKNLFYEDGKTNITYNCVKENINQGRGNKLAIIFINEKNEKKTLTFNELENLINHFIKYLYSVLNFKEFNKKDIVGIHSSANLCSAISMLACAKLGIPHCVIFNDLSKEAIFVRCKLIKCKLLITSTSNYDFKKKIYPIKNKLKLKVLRFSDTKNSLYSINQNDFFRKKNLPAYHKYKFIKSNKPSFILFTSGSTGIPKGIVHSTGGYLLYSKYSCKKKFGLNSNSVILTASDAGWINGHTYALYGPLSIGATTILLEKPITLLNEKILKDILLNLKVNILYLPVTLIRMIKAINTNIKVKSKHLKLLGSMGEPLSKFVAMWFSKKFSKKNLMIVNTYFQTETGGIIASPSYKDTIKSVPFGTVGKPLARSLGVFIKKNKSEIKIKNSWPGCLIDVLNNNKQYREYWDNNKHFRLFDLASKDKLNNYIIHGRIDDVINIRGHRIGSGEVESVILKNKNIKECCAISVNDKLSGKKFLVFLVVKQQKNIIKRTEDSIVKNFGSFAIPEKIIILPEIPKTKSGKILRRLLRELYLNPNNQKLGDLSTMLNYKVVKIIRKILIKLNDKRAQKI